MRASPKTLNLHEELALALCENLIFHTMILPDEVDAFYLPIAGLVDVYMEGVGQVS